MRACLAPWITPIVALLASATLFLPRVAQAQTSAPLSASSEPIALPPPPPPPPLVVPSAAPPSEVPKAWPYTAPVAPVAPLAPAAPPPPKMVKDTYGGHVALADGVAVGLILLGAQTEAEPLIAAGVAGYFLGGPIVHSAHGRGKTSAASLGLRVLGPLASGAVGAGVFQIAYGRPSEGQDDYAAPLGFAVGAAVGLVVSPILDATVLARTEWFNDLPLVPQVSLSPKGGSVGLTGTF